MGGAILTGSTQSKYGRAHVRTGAGWAKEAGTDFWLIAGPNEDTVAAAAGKTTLAETGWTCTSIDEAAGAAADFLSSSDEVDPSYYGCGAASDLIQSPTIFGSYAHGQMAAAFLGTSPTELNLEIYAKFVDATANETASGFGFVEDGGSIVTANDAMAVIHSDGTNFKLRSGAATSSAGAVDDTAWRLWRIRVNSSGCQFWMDGTLQNSTALALQTDEWPVSFGIGTVAAGTNFLKMAWAHVWYA